MLGAEDVMRTIAAPLALAVLLSGCSSQPVTPPTPPTSPAPPAPAKPVAAATPVQRPDAGWQARHRSIVGKAGEGGVEVVFLGDSITEGWGGAGRDVWARDWAPRHALNAGVGGDRTQHVLGRLDDGLLEALAAPSNRVSNVVLLIGTNNTYPPADSAEDVAAGVRAILSRLRERLPGATVTLMAVLPRERTPGPLRAAVGAINERLRPLADGTRVKWLDLGARFVEPDGTIPARLMPDGLHLSGEGYEVWAAGLKGAGL
jgi:lysophospholipase L1-like esterase